MPTGMAIQLCWCIDPHDKRYLAPCASTLQSGLEYFKHRNLRSWLSNISWGYVNVAIIHFFLFRNEALSHKRILTPPRCIN